MHTSQLLCLFISLFIFVCFILPSHSRNYTRDPSLFSETFYFPYILSIQSHSFSFLPLPLLPFPSWLFRSGCSHGEPNAPFRLSASCVLHFDELCLPWNGHYLWCPCKGSRWSLCSSCGRGSFKKFLCSSCSMYVLLLNILHSKSSIPLHRSYQHV